ncbi:MAG TPA: hypothetical protein VKE51_36190 [Vicinamibacterales bacterium]|nr:hypothetical protein [Vicinamibacterales bacterium]
MSEAGAALAHQFEDVEQQHDAATLAMWIFLVTEVMFFGGLLAGYTISAPSTRLRSRRAAGCAR